MSTLDPSPVIAAPDAIPQLRHLTAGRYRIQTDPVFWNQIGPFGGWLAAVAMQAMRGEVDPAYAPRSFTAHYLGTIVAGEVSVAVQTHRQQRTVAGLQATLSQDGRTALVAQAVFGRARGGAEHCNLAPPSMPPPHAVPRWHGLDSLAKFTQAFDYRPAFGRPAAGGPDRESGGWVRLARPSEPSPESLLLLADAWHPPAWAALAEPAPVSTLSLTALFHGSAPVSTGAGDFMAARHRTERVADGYADERGELWWPDGTLALLTQQLTWIDLSRPHKRPSLFDAAENTAHPTTSPN